MKIRFICVILLATFCMHEVSHAQITGFTEPFRKIELASDEAGSIAELLCREGTQVNQGDVLARLDDRVQKLQVESAQHLVDATSALDAARQHLEKREIISDRIQQLLGTGHATESELIRSELELSIAKSKYAASQEEAVSREIDLRRAQVLLDRRSIRAPFTGVVAKLHRKEGEFLSPLRPELVTLIQVDRLLAVFNVPSEQINSFAVGSKATVSFNDSQQVIGNVYAIGVQTDAESGTVQIKVQLDNSKDQLRSGEQCYLEF